MQICLLKLGGFFSYVFFLMCLITLAHVYLCNTSMYSIHRNRNRALDPLKMELQFGYELPRVLGTELGVFYKTKSVPLTAEPVLQHSWVDVLRGISDW